MLQSLPLLQRATSVVAHTAMSWFPEDEAPLAAQMAREAEGIDDLPRLDLQAFLSRRVTAPQERVRRPISRPLSMTAAARHPTVR